MYGKSKNKIKALWLLLLGCYTSILVQFSSLAWASDTKDPNNPDNIDFSKIRADEILKHVPRTQDNASASRPKSGLPALKELLFDEMFMYTAMGAMLLLVALIGSAYVISKRKGRIK